MSHPYSMMSLNLISDLVFGNFYLMKSLTMIEVINSGFRC